jgi:OOP family OmpA-OmpF porin
MYEEYDDGEGAGASLGRKLALGVGVVAIAAAGFFAFKAVTGGDGGGEAVGAGGGTGASTAPPSSGAKCRTAGTPGSGTETTEPASDVSTTTDAPTTTAAATTTDAPTTTAAPTTVPPAPTTAPPPPPPTNAPYATLPDGSPAWAVAIFDVDRITLTGVVPNAEAKQRLQDLAVLSAKPGQAATIDNQLTTNPAVPLSLGVRVVELTSVRFPDGSAEVMPEHAAELDRVVNIMNGLPNVTALVIGHADQRGDEVANYVISSARADAVTGYLASRGIAPSRLSSRAVGEADLLSLNNDAAALALNRRTEFVFFGLLL